ncbi:MAG: hypothetical protein IPM96_04400 [Ignavibacteria bacterium]|nr:hypothetical protein [Ignavibacteria bacterium]
MLNSNLLEILRTFDKQQIKKFGTFLISPYHNRNSNVVKLFNSLKTFYPEFQNTKLEREMLWKRVFPDREYQYGVMKNLIFELQKLSEKFLSFEKFSSNELKYAFFLLDALLEKNLISLFSKYAGHFKSQLNRSKIDLDYFYYRYLIESRELNHLFLSENNIRGEVNSISRPNESLLIFFFLNFFNSNYNSLHDSVLYNSPYDRRYLNSVSDFFKNSPVRDNIFVSIFSSVIDTLSFPDDESFFRKLKSSYAKNSGRLSRKSNIMC